MRIKKFLIFFVILIFILSFSVSYSVFEIPEVSAETAILIDSSSEKVLYSKNEMQRMYPASTTKILTAILTIENCNLNDIVTVPFEAISTLPSGYTVADLQEGEQFTVQQILQVMLVYSANDAANVLAYHISGSIGNFAVLMNNKVEEFGLKNTHFTNPSGMHDDNHYTTAYDLSIIMKYCMKNPTFRKLSTLKSCVIPATDKYEERFFDTTNELLKNDSFYYYKYAIAGKTGFTSQAQNCLVSVSNKDDLELICVVLSAGISDDNLSVKFIDTKSLFEYGYNNYTISKLCERNSVQTQIKIVNATDETKNLDLLVLDDLYALVSQDVLNSGLSPEVKLEKNLFAPISQGQKVGEIIYNIDGSVYSTDLVAAHSVVASNTLLLIVQILSIILILFILYKFLFEYKFKKF